jgi:hypothetical protein
MIDESVFNSMMEDFIKELQAVKEVVKVLPAKVDKLTNKVEGFENKINSIKVVAPKPDLLPVHDIVSDGYSSIKGAVRAQISDLFNKNRLFVLPEDGAKAFINIISKRAMILIGLVLTVSSICFIGFHYWYINSENTRFRNSWYWNYLQQDKKGKEEMDNDLSKFKVDSINSFRTDSIERYQRQQATELRIRELEREADSLKLLRKNQ